MEKEMDYKKLRLKIGLEVHQQFATKKLFCDCSTDMKEEKLVTEFERKINPVAGEAGKIDIATVYEATRGRTFIYHGYEGEECLVDCDEEPPHAINKEALEIALGVAMILKLKIPDVLCIMRKNVSDGSACSSFQRTMVIGRESEDSFIPSSKGKVKATGLYLEEDACKIEKTEKNKVYYSLSRQGIPLLELRTNPDIKTPEQAKEVAGYIGMVFRSFPGARRGIGTIRQDINLSIKNGARVEIKGFQDLRKMPRIIENEVKRQLGIIKEGKKVEKEVRKVNPDGGTSFMRPIPGAARLYPESDLPVIKISPQEVKKIKASLPELKEDIITRLKEKGIHIEVAKELIRQNKLELFNMLLETGVNAILIAKTITLMPASIEAHYKVSTEKLTNDIFKAILTAFSKNKIAESAIEQVLVDICKGESIKKATAKYQLATKEELEKEIKEIISKHKDAPINALIGMAMSKLRGRAEGKVIAEMVKKLARTS